MTVATRAPVRRRLAAKPAKYRNRKVTTAAGEVFDSAREQSRYQVLQNMQRAGLIANLRRQVPFELIPAQRRADGVAERAVRYVADFVYELAGMQVVEDVKSEATRRLKDYVLKRKLLLMVHGISLKETL